MFLTYSIDLEFLALCLAGHGGHGGLRLEIILSLKALHRILKTLSEISDVLVKFSISDTFEFFLCIIRHPYTHLKCFKHPGE